VSRAVVVRIVGPGADRPTRRPSPIASVGGAARADRPGRGCGPLWQVLASLAFALGAVAPLAAEGPFPKAGFPIVDTSIVVEASGGPRRLPIIWMDSDRIMFSADGQLSCYEAGRIVFVTESIVWVDTETGVARFAKRFKHGPMGEEKEEVIPGGGDLPRIGCSDAAVARWQTLPRDQLFTLLRPEHGYLDRGRGRDLYTKYVTFVRPGKPPIELSMYGFEARGVALYAPWAETYVLNADGVGFRPYTGRDPSPKPVIRLLKPDGELIELKPPDLVLDANDPVWTALSVWQDANQDGLTDAGELRSLAAEGIRSLSLVSDWATREDPGGNLVHGESSFERADGTRGVAADASLAYEAGAGPVAPGRSHSPPGWVEPGPQLVLQIIADTATQLSAPSEALVSVVPEPIPIAPGAIEESPFG
jgi:hypothetical protein